MDGLCLPTLPIVQFAMAQLISQPQFNMQQDEQTAHDIFLRNSHSNIFSIKMPSHNSSKQNLDLMAHALILNKLALLPLYENQLFARLYKMSLEFLVNSDGERFKRTVFIEQVIEHVVNWQLNMSMFGAWPYTRACFYSIEQKAKQGGQVLERVILRRGILQPNKQQFINRAQNMSFRSEELKYLIKVLDKEEEEQRDSQAEYELPEDIVYLDQDRCWIKLRQQFNNGKLTAQSCQDCLVEYDSTSVTTFLKRHLRNDNLQQMLVRLRLRSEVFSLILKAQAPNTLKAMRVLQVKMNKK